MFLFKNTNVNIPVSTNDRIKGSIIGFIVGDALGVPVEFIDRETLRKNKINDMEEFGTHHQPKGTWSDDSSMMLATIDGIINSSLPIIDYVYIMKNFLKWKREGKFTPFDNVFDIGNATSYALSRYQNNINSGNEENIICGTGDISSNGNGSLMRILPISLLLHFSSFDYTSNEYFDIIKNISGMTHSHNYSIIGCYIYSIYVSELLKENGKFVAYKNLQDICSNIKIDGIEVYDRIIKNDISKLNENAIKSSGYVVDTLEAVMWSFLTTNTYKDAVLKSVNLGDDTDTVGAITGGLAGIYYGYKAMPDNWVNVLQKKDYIVQITNDFVNKINNSQ